MSTTPKLYEHSTIMESLLRTQAFSLASTTYQLAADTLKYFSPDARSSLKYSENLKLYTLSEVAEHDTIDDCWMVLFDKVYDLSKFINEHPGGGEVLFENAGRDATCDFKGVGHSEDALLMMEKYCIGILVENERLYSRKNDLSMFP